jgi:hypothetical protein
VCGSLRTYRAPVLKVALEARLRYSMGRHSTNTVSRMKVEQLDSQSITLFV